MYHGYVTGEATEAGVKCLLNFWRDDALQNRWHN